MPYQTRLCRFLLFALATLLLPVSLSYAEQQVRVGVLAFRPKPQTLRQWQPLGAALEKAMPERRFVIEALTYPELEAAVAAGRLDFVLTNPGHYVLLSQRNHLSAPLATLAMEEQGAALSVFGGVIFCRVDSPIASLADLAGKAIAAVGNESLGGFQMQAYELKQIGLELPGDVQLLATGMPHDTVVDAVLEGNAVAGFVRTGILENMAKEGKLDLARIKLLNRQQVDGFPAMLSTRLYPEWPFVSLPHVDENLARHVAAALFVLEDGGQTAKAMGIHGFVVPADYTAVADMLRELRMPPFDAAPAVTPWDIWRQYRWQILAFLLLGILSGFLALRLFLAKRRLVAEHRTIQAQQEQLLESEFRLKFALEGSRDGLWDWDIKNSTVFFSKRWKEMLGYADGELEGRFDEWETRIHPDDKPKVMAAVRAYLDGKTGIYENEHRLRCKDGSWKWILARGMVVSRDADGSPLRMIGTHADVTERHQAEAMVRELAYFDALTGLPNRRMLSERLEQAMALSKRSRRHAALMMLDMDNFKPLNDRYGHSAGDLLLVEVAQRIVGCVREVDTVARFGGDEFVIVINELDTDEGESASQAQKVAEKIRQSLARPYCLSVKSEDAPDLMVEHRCTSSIGMAVFLDHAHSQDDLVRWADAAMYQAKVGGRNQIRAFMQNHVELAHI